MCGLIGVFGNALTQKESDIFRCMLLLDVIRGEHSTGVMIGMRRHGAIGSALLKAPGYPGALFNRYPDIFEEKGTISSAFNDMNTNIHLLMGHNRQATVGGLKLDNAHPFRVGNLIGAHNGTIKGGLHILNREEVNGDTDSEKLYKRFSRLGDLSETFEGLEGAAALTYWDREKRELGIFRNEERSLFTCLSKSGGTLLWASEKWMIERALIRTKSATTFEEPQEFPVDMHIRFMINKHKIEEVSSEEVTLETKKYTTTRSIVPVKNTGGTSRHNHTVRDPRKHPAMMINGGSAYIPHFLNFGEAANRKEREKELNEVFNSTEKKEATRDGFVPFGIRSQTGWLNPENLDQEKVRNSLELGCQICQGSLNIADLAMGSVRWMTPVTPVCEDCAKEWWTA